jgi:hypothetical protein
MTGRRDERGLTATAEDHFGGGKRNAEKRVFLRKGIYDGVEI